MTTSMWILAAVVFAFAGLLVAATLDTSAARCERLEREP